jgi:hypothetical protein
VNHDSKGKFVKGNTAGKKDMTKDLAKAMVSKELWWVAKLLSDIPAKNLNQYLKDNDIHLSVIGTKIVDKAIKGDMKCIMWFVELMNGKAIQQSETVIKADGIKINIDKDDISL